MAASPGVGVRCGVIDFACAHVITQAAVMVQGVLGGMSEEFKTLITIE